MKPLLGLALGAALAAAAGAQTPTSALTGPVTQAPATVPRATISNGQIILVSNLPNARDGYYRGTRFDWSGVIASLTYQGHQYFGQWFAKYAATIHDAITGPVEEYVTIPDNAGLGYAAAKVGGTFVKIGVGILRKPREDRYFFSHAYTIVRSPAWRIQRSARSLAFTQDLTDPGSGYGYHYTKTLRLAPAGPILYIEHAFTNTGRLPMDFAVYNHNMFVIDNTASGPDLEVTFPFPVRRVAPPAGPGPGAGRRGGRGRGPQPALVAIRGDRLEYLHELQTGQVVHWDLGGFNLSAADFGARIVNLKTGAGVQIGGDHPLYRVVFWSIRTVLSPELYVHLHVAQGQTVHWADTYRFFTTRPSAPAAGH